MPTTHEQTMKALALANEVRSWGSRYLREIRTGVRSANNLICDPPPYGDKLRLERALRATDQSPQAPRRSQRTRAC
jgi:hypothetical protein